MLLSQLKLFVSKQINKGNDFLQYQKFKKITGLEVLYVFDIDNTLTISKLGAPINHVNPAPRTQMIEFVKKTKENFAVVYLTARSYRLRDYTFEWLKNHELILDKNILFMVSNSKAKIRFLRYAIEKNKKVIYYDDLTYNHENGIVKKYEKVISNVQKLKLDYFNVDKINAFQ